MLCQKVLPLLSEFFDGVLDADLAVQVSQHLGHCIGCRKEFDSFATLHNKLRSLDRVQAPDYLHALVQHRLARQPWRASVRNELERWWSIIRTTEGMWYATRAMGTVMSTVFFFMISSALPFCIQTADPVAQRPPTTFTYGQQVRVNMSVSKIFGVIPSQLALKASRSDPAAINALYLMKYGKTISYGDKEDNFSVLMGVDRSGAAKVESVLQYPEDENLLSNLNEMISSARFRPASEKGRAVPSQLIMTFSKVFVYD